MLPLLAVSHYAVDLPFWRVTSGELWYALIAGFLGVLLGVHMTQPRYARRE
jgi:hypothetical protein